MNFAVKNLVVRSVIVKLLDNRVCKLWAKNYTYKLNTGEVVCKVRGFSLNYKASQIINFESMKKALYSWKNQENTELVTIRTEICRDKKSPKVYNRQVHKHYGVVYDKRIVLNNLETVPYGYRF